MFCSQCGTKMKDGAAFCQECGTKVKSNHVPPTGSVVAPTTQSSAGNNANQGEIIAACKTLFRLRAVAVLIWVILIFMQISVMTVISGQQMLIMAVLLIISILITFICTASVLRIRSSFSPHSDFDFNKIRAFVLINGVAAIIGILLFIIFLIMFNRGSVFVVLVLLAIITVEGATLFFAYKTAKSMSDIVEAEMRAEISKILTAGENMLTVGNYAHHIGENNFVTGYAAITNSRLIYRFSDGTHKGMVALFPLLAKYMGASVRADESSLLNGEFILSFTDITNVEDSKNDITIHAKTGESYKLAVPDKDEGRQWRQMLNKMLSPAT